MPAFICPSIVKLSAYAAQAEPGRVHRHLGRCPRCRAIVEQFREDERFLNRFRFAIRESDKSPDSEARERIVRHCLESTGALEAEDQLND